ncbi:MAG: DUF2357 domain-containing protein [Ruminococcus sp.]|nr:DUF2357 domain-containing protein [Ruminococcus sp.]
MSGQYGEWYEDFKESMQSFGDDELYGTLESLIQSSRNTFAVNRKLMAKAIDVSWVETIENGLIHVDNVLRDPRRTIEDVEEIVPIALSRKITVESVKHLAQHTDLIQSVDRKTGKITPSKILNIHKEESFMTYENKFVNTLVDRLYIFINTRYEKLAQVSRDEEVYTLGYDTFIDNGSGGKMKIEVKLETTESLDTYDDNGVSIWQRVEKLKKAIEGYKGSELCQTLGNTYIRPPVMRTNAIMKNVDLKACLALWQYIESYDKVGYEINVENTAVKPDDSYVEDFYKVVALNLLLFRNYTEHGKEDSFTELKTAKQKKLQPKFLKRFDKELASDYGVIADGVAGYIGADGDIKMKRSFPKDVSEMFDEISKCIEIEKNFLAEREAERLERQRAAEEAERLRLEELAKLEEQRRVEEARRAELERIKREKEEEEKRLQEMLEQKRLEQEAEERERERLEQERLARLEEMRKREEEERLRKEEEARQEAERRRIEENKSMIQNELGGAEGVDVKEEDEEELRKKTLEGLTEEEIEEAKAAMEEENEGEEEPEFEDPREVAARMKLEQQKKEKERKERERAERLKAERKYFESKPFHVIRKQYSKNPIYAIPRFIRYILSHWFNIIPKDTDDPDLKAKREMLEAQKAEKELAKQKRNEMEVYYKKYAMTFRYRFMRWIGDIKFKRKKKKQRKSQPLPKYTPPNRTPEQQLEIDNEMKRLYKEYHVSFAEKIRRHFEKRKTDKQQQEQQAQQGG